MAVSKLKPGEWYGAVERRAQVAGVTFSIVRHEHARDIEPHQHARAYFSLLVSGAYQETLGDVTIEYEPFSFAFHPAPLEHSDRMGEDTTIFTMELEPDWGARVGAHFDTSAWRLELQRGEAAWLGARLLNAFLEDELDPLEVDGIVSEMLGVALRLVEHDRHSRPWVADVERILREQYDRKLSLAELSAATGLHPSSLARGFRLETGVTIGEYLNRIRVQNACRLIAGPHAALAEVADACGFADQSHMTRVFKSTTGMAPGQLRREITTAARPTHG
jgi:AraC family transcriptional regulator